MNKHLTEIAFVLDRSGSMQSMATAAIDGFNHFLKSQQSAPDHARLTLVLFDDEYLVPQVSSPVVEVRPLTRETYVPRNSTALLDAIGLTIEELGLRLAATPEPERPGKVIVAILTDGEENASTQFTWTQIAERIRHQTAHYQWEFFFLGANQDAIATAAKMSIAAGNAATYVGDSLGQFSGSAALARKANAVRSKAAGKKMSPAEALDAEAPLSNILNEEDSNRRGK